MNALSLTIFAVLLQFGAAAQAKVLILRASGPTAVRFYPGYMLPKDATLHLKANDRVSVLLPNGTRTIQGPGKFRPRQLMELPSEVSLLPGHDRRAVIGGVR